MRSTLIAILLFTCTLTKAQVNFVRNPDLENYTDCPISINEINYANFWNSAIDTTGSTVAVMEYYNSCANTKVPDKVVHVPDNSGFFQMPHSGTGMAGGHFFYDGSSPLPPGPLPKDYRDYLQGHLYSHLIGGRSYCVVFYLNTAERTGYAHNNIGAYLDNGSFDDTVLVPGKSIKFIVPQINSAIVIDDTMSWVKVEGQFIADGNETHITIGNFFDNALTTFYATPYWGTQYSYYLIDDISVIETELPADFGPDAGVMVGSSIQIGRVGDTTTKLLDCKWYHKGNLIDSGAAITVNAATIAGIVDTYAVVQTICGNVKTDTVLVSTFSVGLHDPARQLFQVYPNPSDGIIYIQQLGLQNHAGPNMSATVYDLCGRVVYQNNEVFKSIAPAVVSGTYLLELADAAGNKQRERITIR